MNYVFTVLYLNNQRKNSNFAQKSNTLVIHHIKIYPLMLMSMTGFGKASAEAQGKKITVEVKSLNSKQLDLNARMPSVFRQQEIDVRNLVARELERGKVDLIVTVEAVAGPAAQSHVNVDVLAAYRDQIRQAAAKLGIAEPSDWFSVLMRMPDIMISDQNEDVSPEMAEALTTAVSQALDGLKAHRRAEGLRLEEFFATRINNIRSLLSDIEPYEAGRVPHIRARIEEALSKIPVAEYDKGRLEQEMIFYIEKLDVNEEKQRLAQHLTYFLETMDGKAGQGKKLGFIAQEMGREINTLGSKSNQAEMQCIVVRMKDLLEQIKEQVLNVM